MTTTRTIWKNGVYLPLAPKVQIRGLLYSTRYDYEMEVSDTWRRWRSRSGASCTTCSWVQPETGASLYNVIHADVLAPVVRLPYSLPSNYGTLYADQTTPLVRIILIIIRSCNVHTRYMHARAEWLHTGYMSWKWKVKGWKISLTSDPPAWIP